MLLSQRLTNHEAQSARSSCTHCRQRLGLGLLLCLDQDILLI